MGIGTDFGYFGYTSNDTNIYSVKVNKAYGSNATYGFLAYDATKPLMPRGMKMRGVNVMDATTKSKRRIPVGAVDSDAWTDPAAVHTVPFVGDADGVVMLFQSTYEETKARKQHVVINF